MSRYKAAYDTEPAPEPQHASTHPDCPGKCNAAYRAAEKRREEKGIEHDLDPREGDPVWCPPCVTAIRGALDDWPALATALKDEIDAGVTAALTEYVSGSKNRPIHQHEAESLLLDETAEWLGSWEDSLRAERGLAPRDTTDLHHDPLRIITEAARVLPAHLDWHLSGRPQEQWWIAEEFGLELLRLHRKAQALTATLDPEPVRCTGVPCKQCGYKALAWELEDSPARRHVLTQYVYGDEESPLTLHRPLGPGTTGKVMQATPVLLKGSVTGYVYCRKCKPALRLTPKEYFQWVRMCAADPRVRAGFTTELLAQVFGGSVPPQYAKLAA